MTRRLRAAVATALVALGLASASWFASRRAPSVGLAARWNGVRAVPVMLREAVGGTTEFTLPPWLAQPELGARRVAGRVTRNGAPVAKAEVALTSWPDGLPIAVSSTSDDGAFDFGDQPAIACKVAASATGAIDTWRVVDLRDPTSPLASDHLQLELRDCVDHLRGRVVDTEGQPIQHARVHVGEARGAETNATGEYDLCLPPYHPAALAEAPGHAGWSSPLVGSGDSELDFRLAPAAVVVGRVVEAETGVPAANAIVFAKPTFVVGHFEEGPRASWAVTDVDGRFSVSVFPGTTLLFAQGAIGRSSQELMVSALAGETNAPVTLEITRLPTLRGVVRHDGRPVAGAAIKVKGAWPWGAAAISQADGTFVVARVPPDKLVLTAEPFSIVANSLAVMPPFDTTVELEVRPRAKLHGTVTMPTGEPVSGVQLSANGGDQTEDSGNFGYAMTDASGQYSIGGLSPGAWTLTSWGTAAVVSREGIVLADAEDQEVNLVLTQAPRVRVTGRVVTDAGVPVRGVQVSLVKSPTSAWCRPSRADGTFHCLVSEAGTYSVATSLPLGASASVVVSAAGQAEDLTVEVVNDRMPLVGQVVDGVGSPVPNILVRVQEEFRQGLRISPGTPRVITDAQGRFVVEARRGRPYVIEATPTDGSSRVLSPARCDGQQVVITLPTPGIIAGALVGFGSPTKVHAYAHDPSGAHESPEARVEGSTFTIRVAAGRYQVTATSKADAASAEVVVKPGERVHLKLVTKGVGVLQGRVITAATHEPVRGMACTAWPSESISSHASRDAYTDRRGAFTVDPAPAGQVVVGCHDTEERFDSVQTTTAVPVGGLGHVTLEVVPRSLGTLRR